MGCADQRPTNTEPAFSTHFEIAGRIDSQMLWRKTIGDLPRLGQTRGNDHKPVAIERLARNRVVAAAQLCLGNHFFGQILRAS